MFKKNKNLDIQVIADNCEVLEERAQKSISEIIKLLDGIKEKELVNLKKNKKVNISYEKQPETVTD